MARLLMPLPDRDFDVTEVAVPWKLAVEAGHEVVFCTEAGGHAPAADPRLINGVLFGKLGAEPEPIAFYRELEGTPGFRAPRSWADTDFTAFDGLILAGGHAPGMRQYLGSAEVHARTAAFWATGKPVGAICHGTIVLARARDAEGRSVLHGRRTTCLPRYMEWLAYALTFWKLGRYYRTYPAYVQGEVMAALASPADFTRGPITLGPRGTATDDGPAFVVEDGVYVSARWPGDAYLFARRFLARF
ncbi:MAG: DJ-1/PfpI family protein [Myxococcales bacterium]|nr:DJ-1/PfpI family protein [Myxococcales bacterium]MCB9524284.1 DJ-1/PfpI family protein [Myxococcales bacterium]